MVDRRGSGEVYMDMDTDMDMDMDMDTNLSRPGGMRGAIESAALGLKPRHGVSNRKQKSISSNQNLQISNPPHISPQRPCAFRPAALKLASG